MAKRRNSTKREPLSVTAQRDKNRCGIHVGGCGQIVHPGDGNQDHIIPQAFFRHLGPNLGASDSHGSWNLQLMHKTCNANLGGHLHGWPNYQCSCHYLQIVEGNLCVVTRIPLPTGRRILFKDYIIQHPTSLNGVGIFLHPIGPAARIDSSPRREQVTGNKFFHYMLKINWSMVPEFNAKQQQRADRAMWQGRPVSGGDSTSERGTMFPFADLPDIALLLKE